MKISIIAPTCYRPAMFKQMLESLRRTTVGYDVEVIALIDEDNETVQVANDFGVDKINFSLNMRGAISCWNTGLSLSSGDIIVPAGDDQLFHNDWLRFALESLASKVSGCGVIGMNDLAYDGTKQTSTMILFDRAYCKEYMGGVIAPPVYSYYCVDSEWNEKSKLLNKFYWDKRSVVEHLHSAHNKRNKDRHDLFREENNYMASDNTIFEDRKYRGFPIEWESLI